MKVEFVIEGVIVDLETPKLFLKAPTSELDDGIAIEFEQAKALAAHVGETVALELPVE